MSKDTLYPPGDKIQKAVKELSEQVQAQPEESRAKLLQKIVVKYDLSPKECDFLERHFKQEP